MAVPTPMTTRVLPYGEDTIVQAAALIAAGGIVAVPTETVYGLAADATQALAVTAIYAAKGRPSFNPLIVHVLDLAAARALAAFDDLSLGLAEAFWPGPLTLVLPLARGAAVASLVTAGLTTIAIRVPEHRAMRALLAATGKPLAAPSANASGGISPTRAVHVVASLGGRIPLVIDDGATEAGLESTIVSTDGGLKILRPGPITDEALQHFFPGAGRGPVTPSSATGPRPAQEKRLVTAPGQLESHYAPAKPLRLNATLAEDGEWLIGFGPIAGDETLSSAGDLTEAAARLFDLLHHADANDRPRIAIAPVPHHGLGLAINDRLRRAAHRD
ncbi:threonylcarbamoyl-AMP synthase [Sphingomonas sp. So64.6b]|uniref:L-threonylcarbamoyladenylate synthase n=1 Tax=Sphingomonas sp. So64.6b TaxID=2997354 RepID=UPI0016007433|nr:L-threonylcarbamoyladenylate synthase [Sphingomonas sp. So64.6b]QNA85404.1 threonylcarbamoyl-AMP synthase [Sphingomonas sp. So64.6b]